MRRANDFYQTPPWMTRALLHHVPEIGGLALESCAGDGSIARVLNGEGAAITAYTNDIDILRASHFHFSADDVTSLRSFRPAWIVTNPPYKMPLCFDIVTASITAARVGVAMMLRISFLEPTKLRGPVLSEFPPSRILIMPRHSFTGNGKSDSATTAWMIWAKVPLSGPPILSLYKADERFSAPLAMASLGGSPESDGEALGPVAEP